jgi:hypothetical protein
MGDIVDGAFFILPPGRDDGKEEKKFKCTAPSASEGTIYRAFTSGSGEVEFAGG